MEDIKVLPTAASGKRVGVDSMQKMGRIEHGQNRPVRDYRILMCPLEREGAA
jgi:hypothetical protein